MEMAKETDPGDFKFLLTGGVSLGDILPECPCDWLSEKLWGEMNRLDKLPNFKGWISHFQEEHEKYKKYMYDAQYPQDCNLFAPFDHLDKLQFMCIQRTMRPDMLVSAMSNFVVDKIGPYFIVPPPFDLGLIFRDSGPSVPLVFVLSPGADPLNALEKYAQSKKKGV